MNILRRLMIRLDLLTGSTEWIEQFIRDTAHSTRPVVVANRAAAITELARRA